MPAYRRKKKKTPHHCYSCLQGGLAAEKFGELAAWGPSRRHPDSEETPAEHAHLNPCSAQEHEMETVGSASMRTAFTLVLHRYFCVRLCVCERVYIYVCIWIYFDVPLSSLVLKITTVQRLDVKFTTKKKSGTQKNMITEG